jgi:hypothetical protein
MDMYSELERKNNTSFLPWVWVGFNEYNRFGAMIRTL